MTTKERNIIIMRCHKRGLGADLIAECMHLTEQFVSNIIRREIRKEKDAKTKDISN